MQSLAPTSITRRLVSLSLTFALLAPAAASASSSPIESSASGCPTYDFANLFFEDYFGDKWDNANGSRVIRWAPVDGGGIAGDTVARPFTTGELDVVRSAFAAFDNALDTISFREGAVEQAEITIGWVNLSVRGVDGYWNASSRGSQIRFRATIRLAATSSFLASSDATLRHGVLHELGNVLGLGDIRPNPSFESVQEDSWQPPFGPLTLSEFDRGIVRQLYGESTCRATTPIENTLTVTYDSNGGSAPLGGATSTSIGGILESLATSSRDGYTLAGWFTAASGGTQVTTLVTHGQTANFTLYAQWTENASAETTPTASRRITCTKAKRTRVITAEKPRCPTGWKRIGRPVVVEA